MTIPSQTGPITTRAPSRDPMTGQLPTYTTGSVSAPSSQPGQIPVGTDHQPLMGENAIPPTGTWHILGEGAAVFMDMAEMMLTALDKQMTQLKTVQKPVFPLWIPHMTLTQCLSGGNLDREHLSQELTNSPNL